jgi:hypothetical protein
MAGGSVLFFPATLPATVSGTNVFVNFQASMGMRFTGQVSYNGPKTGRLYVTVSWQQNSNQTNGTSMAAPGQFTIDGVQPQGLPANLFVTAWRDPLGLGLYNAAVDPFFTKSVVVSSIATSPIDLGTMLLVDPSPSLPPPPQPQFVLPVDSAAIVGFGGPKDSQGNQLADHFNIYWSTTPNPGPLNKLGAPVNIPASANFAIVNGLTNTTTTYFFGVSSLANGNESGVTNVNATGMVIGQVVPPLSHNITGTVTFPALLGTNTLYVVAQTAGKNGQPNVTRVPIGASATSATYTIPVTDGVYDLEAFIDRGNDGFTGPTNPSTFGSQLPSALVTVSGLNVPAPTFAIRSSNSAVTLATQRNDNGFGANDALSFDISSNLKVPVKVQITSGPDVLVPVDLGITQNDGSVISFRDFWSLNPATAQVGDAYTLDILYSDGTSETPTALVTGVVTSLPVIGFPANNATGVGATPTFTWSAPNSPPAGTYLYWVNVYPTNGFGNGWNYGPMLSSQKSIAYNFDGNGSPLTVGQGYQWNIQVMDSNGNSATAQANFTP